MRLRAKKSFVIFTIFGSLLLSACSKNVNNQPLTVPENVEVTKSNTNSISEVKSEKIVTEYATEEYNFGPADIVCTLPTGFIASDYEGEYIPKKTSDMSSINQIILASDKNLTEKSKEVYKEELENEFKDAYGVETDIIITQYDKIMVDGRPGLWVMYNYEFKGGHYETLVIILFNGTESNIITFLQAPGADWMEQFVASAETIHYEDNK